MRITSWNILHGQSLEPAENSSFAEVAAEFLSDVIALQEVDRNLARSANIDQTTLIANAMKAQWHGFAPTVVGTPGVKWRKLKDNERQVFTTDSASDDMYGISIVSIVPVKKWLRLELGKSLIGMPLLVANEKGRVAPFYVKDEPRVALAAVLENGWTIINTHLSFVPLVNIYQLLKITRWAKKLEKEYATKVILLGDFNLPWGLPTKLTRWKRATQSLTYPSWKPQISFDYILMREEDIDWAKEVTMPGVSISDHRPITVEIA
jgi:endonuclease/exonuclease/phosphatase family metal-dependent hydrolase